MSCEPSIVQLASAQSAVPKPWKKSLRRPFHRRVRLFTPSRRYSRAHWSQSKRQVPTSSFIYEVHALRHSFQCSADGRFLYMFSEQMDLLIVDLQRNTHKFLKPDREWSLDPYFEVENAVVLNATTLLVLMIDEDEQNDSDELYLLRFGTDGERYESRLLHRCEQGNSFTFVIREVVGGEVNVQRAVVGSGGRAAFFRLDIAKAEATLEHTAEFPDELDLTVQMGKDGRHFYAIDWVYPYYVQVYSLDDKKWTRFPLEGLKITATSYLEFLQFSQGTYVRAEKREGASIYSLFRCNFEARRWEELPIRSNNVVRLSSIVSAEDGKEDGMMTVKHVRGRPGRCSCTERFAVERFMFRRPDSLRLLSLLAARKSREEVAGDEGFQQKLSVRPHKVCFPPVFEGMEPIPVRRS